MHLKAALTSAIARLTAEQVPSPRMNAELLLMFTLGCDRSYLYAHPERELTAGEQSRYEAALGKRARGVPAQYITGHQEFWGMDLIVSPAVLIPRPETEHVIEAVLELLKGDSLGVLECPTRTNPNHTNSAPPSSRDATPADTLSGDAIRMVDVGTGSGCIALALARELPWAKIDATDISAAALEIAKANAKRHGLEDRIQFHEADLLGELGSRPASKSTLSTRSEAFDFVVSNPPYVGESEADQVQLEVRKFEPRAAVFAGPTGTEVISRLIPQSRAALRPGGWLVMEISGTIADEVSRLLRGWDYVSLLPDLQGILRVVCARRPSI